MLSLGILRWEGPSRASTTVLGALPVHKVHFRGGIPYASVNLFWDVVRSPPLRDVVEDI